MDLLNQGFDPYDALLQVQHDCEQLQYQMNHVIAVINKQSELLHNTANYIVQLDRRLQEIEQQLKELQ